MRLPNGYGSVTKLSGARRKPYMVRKTTGYSDDGKQKLKVIGYYATKKEALQALADYNDCPYDLDNASITFEELYHKWYAASFDADTNRSTLKNYNAAFGHCLALHKRKFGTIKTADLQLCLDNCEAGYSTASRLKILFRQLYQYALQYDLVKRDLTESLKVKQKSTTSKKERFSTEEVQMLWREQNENEFIPFILIMIYSGCRIMELLNLKKENVHFDEQYFDVVESKTEAGVRKVPIADKVLPFWNAFYNRSQCEKVFTTLDGKMPLSYDNFIKRYWRPINERLGMKHSPHETRHTCISMLTTANINPTFIKIIVGHKSMMDLTEKTYTHIEIKDLLAAINSI